LAQALQLRNAFDLMSQQYYFSCSIPFSVSL
jgi:hypothetical protein